MGRQGQGRGQREGGNCKREPGASRGGCGREREMREQGRVMEGEGENERRGSRAE